MDNFLVAINCCIFAFLAAVYLIGEAKEVIIKNFLNKPTKIVNIAVVVAGAIVIISG